MIFKQRAKSECNGIKVTIVHATNQMSSEFSLMLHCDHFWFQRRKTSIFCSKIQQNVFFSFAVNDLKRLMAQAGGKLDHSLYAQSATHVGSLSEKVSSKGRPFFVLHM